MGFVPKCLNVHLKRTTGEEAQTSFESHTRVINTINNFRWSNWVISESRFYHLPELAVNLHPWFQKTAVYVNHHDNILSEHKLVRCRFCSDFLVPLYKVHKMLITT